MIKYNAKNINDWNFGNDNIAKVYHDGNVVYQKVTSGSSSRLPQGYTEVEYAENQTYAYFDFGFVPNQDTRLLFSIQVVTSTGYGKFLSSGQWDTLNAIQLQYETGITGRLKIDWGTTTSHYTTNVRGDLNLHTYDWNKNEFYRDDVLIGSTTYGNFQSPCSIAVFRPKTNSCVATRNNDERLLARLYSFKIYDNGTLVRDLVPCINPNNVVGAYDIVNNVFYGSADANYSFVAGSTV